MYKFLFIGLLCLPLNSAPIFSYHVVNSYPHDHSASTQGLIADDGYFYESTGPGQANQSTLRKVIINTGIVEQRYNLEQIYYGEGLARFGNYFIQLTYRHRVAFVYEIESFTTVKQLNYPEAIKEGWGITSDDTRLIVSDGSDKLYFLDPESFELLGNIVVTDDNKKINMLNELEYIKGEIFANIFYHNAIARINPTSGHVLGWIDLSGLLSPEEQARAGVLNGIAYDKQEDRLFVTGKNWPKIFEIRVVSKAKEN